MVQRYVLGLDMGTNSIGWAAVRLDGQNKPSGILGMGARIFSDGRDPQSKASRAVDRRIARGMRRRRDRYLRRRTALLETLTVLELMPGDETARNEIQKLDPYELRARALDAPLKPYELGRALFHLNQRRGFKSNRKADAGSSEDSQDGTTWASISELRTRISESGSRTLGEYLSSRKRKGRFVRARAYTYGLFPDRALYENEYDAIRKSQEHHHSLKPAQWDQIRQIIFHQRPLKPVEPGWCLFEEGEHRAPRALPAAQDFRIVQEVNNIKVRQPGDGSERFLTADERAMCVRHLRHSTALKFDRMLKILGLEHNTEVNLGRGGRESLKGDETSAVMRRRATKKRAALFGKSWDELPFGKHTDIVRTLLDEEDRSAVIEKAKTNWGLDGQSADALAAVRLPTGHMNLSVKAIEKLLPHMENDGFGLYEAVAEVPEYTHHSDFRPDTAYDELPYYGRVMPQDVFGANPDAPEKDEVARFGRLANPTVHIGLNQLRRVVNKLIEVYGKPEKIVVELARDLKLPPARINELNKTNRENQAANERRAQSLRDEGIAVTGDAIRRLRLWEEQGPPQARRCPYTGKNISFAMAISAATEIDHILPRSRTLDDSYSNKVLCISDANRRKGDRSPFEAFGADQASYDAIVVRTREFPQNKRWRFKSDAMDRFEDQEKFLDRQLNETMYLSPTTRTYLAHLYNEKKERRRRVDAVPGRLTAALRRGWGLDSLLNQIDDSGKTDDKPEARGRQGKQRSDHRHHAIDAFVVAVTSPALVKVMSEAAGQLPDVYDNRPLSKIASMLSPWNGFSRETLRPHVERIVVSHRQDHGTRGIPGKTSGQLHNETAYGLVEEIGDGRWRVAVRKSLVSFTRRTNVEAVRDPAMREALLGLWDSVVDDGLKPAEFAANAATGVQVNGRSFKVRTVRTTEEQRVIVIRDSSGKPYKGYKPDANEFAELWRLPDDEYQLTVVRRFDANRPGFDQSSLRPHPAARKLMRLQINDCVRSNDGPVELLRVCKITAGGPGYLYLAPVNEANVAARVTKGELKYVLKSGRQLGRGDFRKVGVDEIGRVLDPHRLS